MLFYTIVSTKRTAQELWKSQHSSFYMRGAFLQMIHNFTLGAEMNVASLSNRVFASSST